MKSNIGIRFGRMAGVAAGAGLALGVSAQVEEITFQSISDTVFDTGFIYAPPNSPPTINGTWNVPQLAGTYGVVMAVRYEITARLESVHAVTSSTLADTDFILRVGSTFQYTVPGGAPQTLLPQNNHEGRTAETLNALLNVPENGVLSGELMELNIGANAQLHQGTGTLPLQVTAALNPDLIDGFHNDTDVLNVNSPYTFINNPKIYSVAGWSGYRMVTMMSVTYTYFVPEAGTLAGGALMLMLAGGLMWHRFQRAKD